MVMDMVGKVHQDRQSLCQKKILEKDGSLHLNVYSNDQQWWDLGKSEIERVTFSFDWSAHLERYILLKTPSELDKWFQSYEQLKGSQNKGKQKKSIPFSGCISQSMQMTSTDPARLQHMWSFQLIFSILLGFCCCCFLFLCFFSSFSECLLFPLWSRCNAPDLFYFYCISVFLSV